MWAFWVQLPPVQQNLIFSALALVAFLLLRWLLGHWLEHRETDPVARHRARRLLDYGLGLVLLVTLARIWLWRGGSLATYLGLLSAGLAIALQSPLTDLAGWLFIVLRRPFDLGDRIQVGDLTGDVVDLRMFQFVLLELGQWVHADQSTGRLVFVPNKEVFTKPLYNYTRGFPFIWDEIAPVFTFESDWQRGVTVLETIARERVAHYETEAREALRRFARQIPVRYEVLSPTVYVDVVDHGVRLTVRYLVPVRRRRELRDALWRALLEAIAAEPSLTLAYPTFRVTQG